MSAYYSMIAQNTEIKTIHQNIIMKGGNMDDEQKYLIDVLGGIDNILAYFLENKGLNTQQLTKIKSILTQKKLFKAPSIEEINDMLDEIDNENNNNDTNNTCNHGQSQSPINEIVNKNERKYDDDQNDFKSTPFPLSGKTKTAITTAHFLVHMVSCYLDENSKSSECNIDIKSILSNIFVIGGACRNYLLKKDINDIDIVCNTRELNKIHLLHLQKYHNTYNKQNNNKLNECILWKLYLNKL
eukprot:439852_1